MMIVTGLRSILVTDITSSDENRKGNSFKTLEFSQRRIFMNALFRSLAEETVYTMKDY